MTIRFQPNFEYKKNSTSKQHIIITGRFFNSCQCHKLQHNLFVEHFFFKLFSGSVESDTEPTKTNSLSDVSSTVSSLSLSPTTCTVPTPSMSDPDQTSHTVALTSTPPLSATSRSKSPTVVGSNATRTKSQSPVSNVKSPTQMSSGKPSQSATTTIQNLFSEDSLPQNTPIFAPSQLPVNGSSSQPPVNDQSQPPVNSQKQHQHSRQNHHSGILNLTGIGPTILFRSDTCNLKPRLSSTSSSRCW